MTAPIPELEAAFDVVVHLGPLEDHGLTRAGHRRVIPITGGTVRGAFDAHVLPGGADWQILRADGAVDVGARYSARTESGAYVLIHSTGCPQRGTRRSGGTPARRAGRSIAVLFPHRARDRDGGSRAGRTAEHPVHRLGRA